MDDVEHSGSARTVVQVVIGTAAIAVAVVHASMIGVTTRPQIDGRVFLVAAIVGAACGVATLLRPTVEVLSVTVVVHGLFVVTWLLSRTAGLPVAGLHARQPVGVADAIAATLSALVVGGGVWLVVGSPSQRRVSRLAPSFASILVVAVAVPALLSAADGGTSVVVATRAPTTTTSLSLAPHVHDDTEGNAGADAQLHGTTHEHAATPVRAFDPSRPIDLSGTPGVTQVQQKQAELLLAQTVAELPQYADPATAEAKGYHSIGDSLTGDEHFMNWSAINDGHVLDPNFPESLVYNTRSGKRVLEAAMFILPNGYTLDDVPQVGGSLIQWHIHDDLCFTDGAVPVLAGFHPPGQLCGPGRESFPPTPMIHVWITKNPCGPFAALEGVGAGQIKAGDVRACDHVHGSGTF
jgi:hypothetical protein